MRRDETNMYPRDYRACQSRPKEKVKYVETVMHNIFSSIYLSIILSPIASNGARYHPRRAIDDDDDADDTRDLLRSLLRQASLRKIGFDSDDEDNYSNRFYFNEKIFFVQ
ncbi:unnamed protein product [Adineta ricciae]|uniref:Uncharacterized protein n=1 Tax=Adineta ricciae TaxID=249248 RepID=A0A815NK19_ADIRI|nr:unnamed protein product [Adineta ricciae]